MNIITSERATFLRSLTPLLHRSLADLLDQQIERESFHVTGRGDAVDRAVHEAARDEAFVTDARRTHLINLITLAIRRSELGDHGVCIHCSHEVSTMRLRANPYAALCIDCQDKADQGLLRDPELNRFGMPLNPLKPLKVAETLDAIEQPA